MILLVLLLLAAQLPLSPELLIRAHAAGTDSPVQESGNREALSVLSFTAEADEVSNEVESTLILENTGNASVSATVKLPRLSAGIEKGSLDLYASEDVLRLSEDEVFLTIAPKKTQTLSYRYRTKEPLIQSRAIGVDFKSLLFSESGTIGHFSVSITLREEDLPLVSEVFPINYTLEETTVSVELFDIRPNSLFNRFYLIKETYRNLKSGREYEINEPQQFVLDHYREWFRDGLGEAGRYGRESSFYKAMYPDSTPRSDEEPVYTLYRQLAEGTEAFRQIFLYLYLRDEIQNATDTRRLAGMLSMDYPVWPLIAEIARQRLFGDELHLFGIGYEKEPSLGDHLLYVKQALDDYGQKVETFYVREEEILTARPSWIETILSDPIHLTFRVSKLGVQQVQDAEAIESYLEAIGAEGFVKQKLLDNRDGRYRTDIIWGNGTYYSAASSGNLTAEDLRNAYYSEDFMYQYGDLEGFSVEDPVLSSLSLPAFTHYIGAVEEDYRVRTSQMPGYLGRYFGLEYYEQVMKGAAAQAMLRPISEKRERIAAELQKKIGNALSAPLHTAAFYETGDPEALEVLECSLRIREESSMVSTDLLVQNAGTGDCTVNLALPTLINSIKRDSFTITDTSAGVPIYGGKLYVTIPAGGALRVSYSYQTSISLSNTGAIGMDFKKLLFDPNGRIGHFGARIELLPEDVPLVNEIFPVCYSFDGTTVSMDLWDFAPNALLNRFFLSKETYRGIKMNLAEEWNDTERFVLRNIRKWLREDLAISDELLTEKGYFDLLDEFIPPDPEDPYRSDVAQHSTVL
ncbi:MAG: hypothetical protein IKY02_01560, partial [Lachnospiraceae bacterium]|nr:hypothetical protein [Lachnospiraceae bacterium]